MQFSPKRWKNNVVLGLDDGRLRSDLIHRRRLGHSATGRTAAHNVGTRRWHFSCYISARFPSNATYARKAATQRPKRKQISGRCVVCVTSLTFAALDWNSFYVAQIRFLITTHSNTIYIQQSWEIASAFALQAYLLATILGATENNYATKYTQRSTHKNYHQ